MLPHSRSEEQEADRIGVELRRARAATRGQLWHCGRRWRPAAAGSHRSGLRRIRRTRRASVTCRTMRSACCPCMRRRRSSGWRPPRDAQWHQRASWTVGSQGVHRLILQAQGGRSPQGSVAKLGRVPVECGYCFGTLPSRLREVNQPVIITRNRFSRPCPCPLACI